MARPREFRERDGTVIFTHLFSAPLIERKKIHGKTVAEKVDELSYQGERDTLLKTLANAGKKVRFLSEAANTESFRRSVGCPSPYGESYGGGSLGGGGNVGRRGGGILDRGNNSSGSSKRSCCRDGLRRIVHFTGHGVPGQLTFEDKQGQLQYVDEENLLDMLQCQSSRYSPLAGTERKWSSDTAAETGYASRESRPMGGGRSEPSVPQSGLQLVFLSSCHSESVAKCFIQAGVPHVIAVKHDSKVLDHKAADFAESIYAALLRGDTVRQAFALGSARVGASDRPEEGHRFLLLPLNGNHDVPVFEEVPAGQFVNETPPEPTYRLDAVTEHFWGRAVDVQKVVMHMADGTRCVTITGQKGIGKTQVLLKACAYTRERHVFRDMFFCRVDKAGRGNDACHWLEKGFQLPIGSLSAHNMEGAVAKITAHVKRDFQRQDRARVRGPGSCDRSRASRRVLLVLDGCTRHVLVGQERVELRELLKRLFYELPNLTAAVTMQATSPTELGGVGIPGEEVIVVEGLDDISTAKLFTMCCSRRLQIREMDPTNEAETMKDGKLDTLGAFAKGDIIRALRGHPSCVEDLCRLVHDENSLLFRKQTILEHDIPKIQKQYAYERSRQPSISRPMSTLPVPGENADVALERFWAEAAGAPIQLGFYGSPGSKNAEAIEWGELCTTIKKWFAKRVPGARSRPLEEDDFALFAEDPALWDGHCPASMAASAGLEVAAMRVSREKFKRFWLWFWNAIGILCITGAWTAGENAGIRCFQGFLSSSSAESLLAATEPGTFLIRFSTSKPATLVVQFISRDRKVRKAAISVMRTGEVSCTVGSGEARTYRSLSVMALSLRQLAYLHPDWPKHEAFHLPQRRSTMPASVRSHELSVR